MKRFDQSLMEGYRLLVELSEAFGALNHARTVDQRLDTNALVVCILDELRECNQLDIAASISDRRAFCCQGQNPQRSAHTQMQKAQ